MAQLSRSLTGLAVSLAFMSSVTTFAAAQPAPRVDVTNPDYVQYKLRRMFQDNWLGSEAGVSSDLPNRIRIEYVPPKNPEHQMLYDRLRENRVLETVQGIFGPFRLPVDLVVKTQPCDGLVNSWYDSEGPGPTVHLCYELLQHILDTAPQETTPAGITPRDAIVGQFVFWTANEMGQAFFDIYQVPLFGSRDFAADQFATYVMLQFGKERARSLIGGAAYAVNALVKNYKENPEVAKRMEQFASVHGLPEQRFYNILCIAYGADPKTFPDLESILTKRRAGNCQYDYQDLVHAWRTDIMPHIDQQLARQVLDTNWLPATGQVEPDRSAPGQTKSSQESTIADNDSVFVDGQSFKIMPGLSKRDATGLISGLGARELGPGAIIFRSEGKLYIVDAPLSFEVAQGNLMPGFDRPNRIRIEYVPPKNPEHQMLYDRIRQNRLLELVQAVFSPFRFPVDLVVKTMGCDGKVNAWYSPEGPGDTGPTLHICYELLQYILKTAPNDPTPAGISPRDAIVGQFMAWITHEMGHAVFDTNQVPQWGGRERAADLFAAYVMLQFGPERARRLIGGTTYAFKQFMKNYQENPEVQYRLAEYADVHDFPQQRFFNVICMAYGADPKTFADVADILPRERAGNCKNEYQDFSRAWRSRITPHIDQQLARQVLDTTWLPQAASAVPTR